MVVCAITEQNVGKLLKLVLLGDYAVGKTTLKTYYLTGEATEEYSVTIGVDFITHETKVPLNGRPTNIKIAIWDIAGQRRFEPMRKSLFTGASGALVLFDITRRATFENIRSMWVDPFWGSFDKKLPLIVVSNKIDLEDEREVPKEEALELVKQLSDESGLEISLAETSALEGINVDEAFTTLIQQTFRT